MRRNGYGWIGLEEYAQQSSGFFVDRSNRILFWPSKKQPGYILDEEATIKIIMLSKHKISSLFTGLLFLSILSTPIAFMAKATSHDSNYYDNIINILLLILIVRISDYFLTVIRNQKKQYPVNFDDYEKIFTEKPKHEFLKPSEREGKFKFYFLASLSSIFSFGALWELTIGDNVSNNSLYWFFLIIFLPLLLLLIRTEIYGVYIKDINFYKFTKNIENCDILKFKKDNTFFQQYFSSEFNWLKSKWKIWLFFIFIILSSHTYQRYTFPALNVENIAGQYEKLAPNSPYAIKWVGTIPMYVNPYVDSKFRDELISIFKKNANALGFDIQVVDHLEKKQGISVFLSQTPQKDENGELLVFKGTFTENNGKIQHCLARISIASLGKAWSKKLLENQTERQRFIDSLFYYVLKFEKGTSGADQVFRDNYFNKIDLNRILTSVHYDPRIKAGMPYEETKGIVEKIIMEIEASTNFEIWLRNKKK